ncbi:MAG: hypothetical protein U0U69_08285 [Acidimicrobiia bacterium]
MERLKGKLIETDAFDTFAKDFVEWAGPATANATLEDEVNGMSIELGTKRSTDHPNVTARGLAGGGEAVAAWLESEGYEVLREEPDFVVVDVESGRLGDTAASIAAFLAPSGRWRLVEISVRR